MTDCVTRLVHIDKTGAGCSGRAARFVYMDQPLLHEKRFAVTCGKKIEKFK